VTTASVHVSDTREQKQVRDAYGMALALVLTSTLALVAAGSPVMSPLAAGAALLQLGALLLTLRVSGIRRRLALFVSLSVVALFVIIVGGGVFGGPAAGAPLLMMWLLLTLATIAAITGRLVTYKAVTLQLVMGLLVIYVLIGTAFGLGFQLSEAYTGTALVPEDQGISGALYFSFVTLATLGYGDVLPGNNVARAMAIAEALIGQLYLVSVVSLAVSRLSRARRSLAPSQDDGQEG